MKRTKKAKKKVKKKAPKKRAPKKRAPKRSVARKKATKKAPKKKATKKKATKKGASRKKTSKRAAKRIGAGKKVRKKARSKPREAPRRRERARPVRTRAERFVPEGSDSLLIVMSGPSGAGKSTLARRVAFAESRVWRSVSMTTRAPRDGELDGIDYLFATREEFGRAVEGGAMLEHATVHGEMYGTPRGPVVDRLAQGRDVLLEIDVQGAIVVREVASDAILVFVVPPSRAVLEQRLRERRSEDESGIQSRLGRADDEVVFAERYDYLVTNGDLERAVRDVLAIMSVERNRMQRRLGFTWQTR